jgi:hypothetical protein
MYLMNAPLKSERFHRLRSAIAGGLVAALLPAPTIGEPSPRCAEMYTAYMNRLKQSRVSPEQWATQHRFALRVYDACETGDLHDAEGLFARLDRSKY